MNEEVNQEKKTKIFKNIIINILYEVLNVLTPLLTAPYISRILMPDGVGIYSYTYSLVTYFVIFAALGKVGYGVKEIATKRDQKNEYSKSFWEIHIISTLTSIFSLIIWLSISIVYTEYKIYLLIMTMFIIASLFDISWLYKGLEKYEYTISINSICKILSMILIFTLVKEKNDIDVYCIIMAGSVLFGNISMWLFLPKVISKCKIEKKTIIEHFKHILVYFIPTIATSVYTVLDKTLIGLITHDNVQNGYYEQAVKILTILKSICFLAINGVMNSRTSYLYQNNDVEAIKKSIKMTFDITLFLSIGACFALLGMSDIFVPLFFGDNYQTTVVLLYIFSFIIPIICVGNVLVNTYYVPTNKINKATKYMIIGSIINLILNIPLIYYYKSVGAAIASVVAELVITILCIFNSRKFYNIKKIWSAIWKKMVAGIVMLLIIFSFNKLISLENDFMYLIVDSIIGISTYILLLIILSDGIVKNIFKDILNKIYKRKD